MTTPLRERDTPLVKTIHEELDRLAEQGQLRWLAPTFARFLDTLGATGVTNTVVTSADVRADPGEPATKAAPPALLLAAALLTEFEGRGHACLDLAHLLADPGPVLGWPQECWTGLSATVPDMPVSAAHWIDTLSAWRQVHLCGGNAADAGQPLVLDGQRLYLRRYWDSERRLAAGILQRVAAQGSPDAARAKVWLDRLFAPPAPKPGAAAAPVLPGPDLQKAACAVALRRRVSIITGGPGTGKTYTVARLLALLFAMADDPGRLRIALAAPTGKAAMRMKESIAEAMNDLSVQAGAALPLAALAAGLPPAATLHSLLGVRPDSRQWRHHAGNLLEVDVLVVDEASMIHLEMMTALIEALPAQSTLVLLGDKDQLASVEAGAVLGDLCAHAHECRYDAATRAWIHAATGQDMPQPKDPTARTGTPLDQQIVMLTASRRFEEGIGTLAAAINAGDAEGAVRCLQSNPGELAWMATGLPEDLGRLALGDGEGGPAGYGAYLTLLRHDKRAAYVTHAGWVREVLAAFDRFRILCAVREGEWGVEGINRRLEKLFDAADLLKCRGEWYVGRPVMVTRNDHALKVYNGDVGIALPDPDQPKVLRVYFASSAGERGILVTRLAQVETAFAMTVHKSQGSEFEHVVVVLPKTQSPVATRELLYTGTTRARKFMTLLTGSPGALEATMAQRTRRASGLHDRLKNA